MTQISRGRHTHADRLERWLGKSHVEQLSQQFRHFYYPVPLHGVPGNVFLMPGGDFAGEITAGQFASKHDAAAVTLRKVRQKIERVARRASAAGTLLDLLRAEDKRAASIGAFASVDEIVAAFTGGKGQTMYFRKTGTASNAIGNAMDLFPTAGSPAPAPGPAAGAPGGQAWTATSNGSLGFKNVGAANSGHYLNWTLTASVANNSLLLYDRLFAVSKTMSSAAAENVTGVPTRYQNTSNTAVDYIGGNFVFPVAWGALGATAHNWNWTYTDQDNNASTGQQMTGVSACVLNGIDLSVGNWFMSLQSGDLGVKAITQMTCSASVTGTLEFVLAHPIAVNACPVANLACLDDGLYTSLNLTPILDNACLAFLELPKPATTATTYSGIVRAVSE